MLKLENLEGINSLQINALLDQYIQQLPLKEEVLLVVPDITRYHSKSGEIASYLYTKLAGTHEVKVLIALGSHQPMTHEECAYMYPAVPYEKIVHHNWRTDVVSLGEVPREFVQEVSGGLCDFAIAVQAHKLIADYDNRTIISIGQVVPHEVVGMANGNKNIFVGCGGNDMINSSHMLGAVCDMEKVMGRDFSPVRKVFDFAEKQFLSGARINYILSVLAHGNICGIYMGNERSAFEAAVDMSQKMNLNFLDKPLKKIVVRLDEREYHSTWLGNKAIYRTRMAIEDGGELIILAKGVERFGEDDKVDELIRKYGYVGRDKVLALSTQPDLAANLSAAAHLIHGSSNGRFSITYAVKKLTRSEVEKVNFIYADYDETVKKYNPDNLQPGLNTVDGEEIYYIDNPSVGLWAYKNRFFNVK